MEARVYGCRLRFSGTQSSSSMLSWNATGDFGDDHAWVKAGAEGSPIFWLRGPAGAGKLTIAQTVAETCGGRNELASSFFFARTAAHRKEVKYLFLTIVVQITLSAPEKRRTTKSSTVIHTLLNTTALGSIELLASLLKEHSAEALQPSLQFPVIVNGLDECQRNDDQRRILAQVPRMVHTHHLPLRFLIVSRPKSRLLEAIEDGDLANIARVLPLYGDHQASSNSSTIGRRRISSSNLYGSRRLLHLCLHSYQIYRRGILLASTRFSAPQIP